ncbi:astacin-like [Bolinopsis microptera]|uniref:astacin-like n=1 Tax=Bolinopsis microptera TaxID=2820187 RepID=UPI003079A011
MDHKYLTILLIVMSLVALNYTGLTHDIQDGEIFEGDILWDDNLHPFWDRIQKRSVNSSGNNPGNNVSTVGNNSNTQNSGNGVLNQDNSTNQTGNNPPNTNSVWSYKTSDNEGSLTYTIPYEVSAMTDPQAVVFIKVAMKEWNKGTCALFVPKTTETNFVSLRPGNSCSSHVGMVGGQQFVTISPGCQYDHGALMHELGHVLGLFHEHTRQDRDQYVQIIQGNLLPGAFGINFKKMTHSPSYVRNDNYDYVSVMHYGKSHFESINRSFSA